MQRIGIGIIGGGYMGKAHAAAMARRGTAMHSGLRGQLMTGAKW